MFKLVVILIIVSMGLLNPRRSMAIVWSSLSELSPHMGKWGVKSNRAGEELTNMCLSLTCPVLTSIPFHLLLAEAVLLPSAGQHSHCPAPALHPCGDGPGPDGAQPV